MHIMETPESQYTNLIRQILEKGSRETSRNGTTLSLFGYSMRFSLQGGALPLLTTKRVAWKTCFRELQWFIRGSTDNRELQVQDVHIWDGNATPQFLESRGLGERGEGDLGPIYGHQWRYFGAPYVDYATDYTGQGVDQLQGIIDQLRTEEGRSSRRLVMSAWNPAQIDEMALPPCHVLSQFHVRDGKYLSCALYQRSGDVGVGVPFNIASYSFLTHLLARHCDLVADEFVYFLGNAHIYEDHIESLKVQIERPFFPFPAIEIGQKRDRIEDYNLGDVVWTRPYQCHGSIKMEMVA
jgi:thymidylate synthase